jgi:RNA polymerase sigma factor (sigma-70 family)
MGGIAAKDGAARAVEEAHLARATAAGDGTAFASLYDRYEQRVYNLAYRVTGSEPDAADATEEAFLRAMRRPPHPEDRELAFGSCLFIATRNACYDLMKKRRPGRPSDAIRESADEQEEIRDANLHLPEHQREALALRGLEGLSYDEIAAIMETSPNSVAQLVSRGRINLRDELCGTALATVAAPSPGCERALPLIAAREDGQLEPGSDDDAWLDEHLAGCERCELGVEAMREADASYRAWAPIAAVPWLFEETAAKAAALAGADWSEATASSADPRSPADMPPAYLAARGDEGQPSRRRRAAVAGGLAALLLGAGVAAALMGSESSRVPHLTAADTHPSRDITASKSRKEKRARPKAPRTETAPQATAAASPVLVTEAGGRAPSEPTPAADHNGAAAVEAPHATAAPESKPAPPPTPEAAPQPAPTPLPTVSSEAQAPATATSEEPPKEHSSKGKGPPSGPPPRGGH